MNLVPKSLSRTAHRTILKLNAGSPTILVVAGVVGLGATAVMAAKATRKIDPILDEHKKARIEIDSHFSSKVGTKSIKKAEQKALVDLYMNTGWELTKLYGPTMIVGVGSAISVLGGHKILRARQLSTLAAYTSLGEQFNAYRKRVADTLGEDVEKGLYEGAHGEWSKDPKTGESVLTPAWDPDSNPDHYLRPWFDETNVNWTKDPTSNYLFLKGVQQHMNNLLQIRGHVFLNDVYDSLRIPRTREGAVIGWLWNSAAGDNYVDFGFMTSIDPHTVAFRNEQERTVRLNFNVDGPIWDQI